MNSPSRTSQLASFLTSISFDQLSDEVVQHTKRCVLDTIGCALFGSTLPWSQLLQETLAQFGRGDAHVWASDRTLPLDAAVLVNGTMVHAFELDDLHKGAIFHPGGVTLPAVAAACDLLPPVSGEQFIAAVVAGYEAAIRVGLSSGVGLLRAGWHPNGVLGTFAAAAGVGNLIGLDAEQMEGALGMAATQSSGLMSSQYGSMIKRMHAGKAAQGGFYAAFLARDEFKGIDSIFEHEYGGYPYPFTSEYDLDLLVASLGKPFEIVNVGFKFYAACGSSHTSIDAMLNLKMANDFAPDDVARCRVFSSTATWEHVGWEYVPDSVTTAQMNLPYALACALLRGQVGPEEFTSQMLIDQELLDLASRTEVVVDPSIDALGSVGRHTVRVQIELNDGRVFEEKVEHAKGSEHFPLSDGEIRTKFVQLAGAGVGQERALKIMASIDDLEASSDVREIFNQL
jgi:aconitate decarboxylase